MRFLLKCSEITAENNKTTTGFDFYRKRHILARMNPRRLSHFAQKLVE